MMKIPEQRHDLVLFFFLFFSVAVGRSVGRVFSFLGKMVTLKCLKSLASVTALFKISKVIPGMGF
jgi:hypothetical protein